MVTGAASGIGRALAIGLRSKGCHLALVDVNDEGLANIQRELSAAGGTPMVTAHAADVSDETHMRALAAAVIEAHGAVHVLINNAGVAHEAAFPQTTLADWRHVLDVNLWGVIHGCHVFMPHLAKAERAHIVNMSSFLGLIAMPGQSAYCTSKFAVRGLSECLWEELRATSIGLTLVHPGAVDTGIMTRALGDDPDLLLRLDRWYARHAMPPERVSARIIRAIERGTPRLLIAPEVSVGDALKRLLPVTGNRLVSDAVIRVLGVGDVRAARAAQWRRTAIESGATPAPPRR